MTHRPNLHVPLLERRWKLGTRGVFIRPPRRPLFIATPVYARTLSASLRRVATATTYRTTPLDELLNNRVAVGLLALADARRRILTVVKNGARGDAGRARYRAWAELLKRTFDIDVLDCPKCHGRMAAGDDSRWQQPPTRQACRTALLSTRTSWWGLDARRTQPTCQVSPITYAKTARCVCQVVSDPELERCERATETRDIHSDIVRYNER